MAATMEAAMFIMFNMHACVCAHARVCMHVRTCVGDGWMGGLVGQIM